MRHSLLLIVLLVGVTVSGPAASAGAPSAALASEPVVGQVMGEVVNLTAGAGPVSGVTVTLYGLEDFSPRETYTTTVAADGTYLFDPIALVPGYSYIATLEYQNVAYGSSFVVYDGSGRSLRLDIEVYEAESSPDPIQVSRLHILADFAQGLIRISELYIFDNRGDRVYVGPTGDPEAGTLELPLPAGAQRPTVERGMGEGMVAASSSVFEVEGGYRDTLPVRPGPASQQLMVVYEMAYEDGVTISHPLPYPVASASVILPDIGVGVESELLEPAGARSMQGTPFIEWEAEGLAAGEILSFRIVGKPDLEALAATRVTGPAMPAVSAGSESPLFVGAGENTTTWAVGIGSLAVAVAAAAAVLIWRRPRGAVARDDRGELLQAIVDLDAAHERGEIPTARYQHQREVLKAELRSRYEEA